MLEALVGLLQSLFSANARASEQRMRMVDATRLVGTELEALAELYAVVLDATGPDGQIRPDRLHELHARRVRNWNQWVSILGSGAYQLLSEADRKEIESLITIASAAPGNYVEEIFLVQIAVQEGYIRPETRAQFSGSIARLRHKATQLRLAV